MSIFVEYKKDIRTLGIDDSAFIRDKSTKTFVFGVVTRGYSIIEGILRTEILVDGLNATKAITDMIKQSKFRNQIKAIFLRSATIGAFNLINMPKLFEEIQIPVITVLSQAPNANKVKKALIRLKDRKQREEIISVNPAIKSMQFYNNSGRRCKIYFQQIGIEYDLQVKKLLEISSYVACYPECLRIADLIGKSFKNFII